MDLAFFSRAERMLDRRPHGGVDYDLLLATLSAHQAASVTGRAVSAARGEALRACDRPHAPLVELLAAGPAWREAKRAQRGMFHKGVARSCASTSRKASSPARLPSHFSLPYRLPAYGSGTGARMPGGLGDSLRYE